MQTRNYNVALRVSVLFLLFFSLYSLAEYVEGIDTTDTNGYGLDSAFKVDSIHGLSGQKLACYSGMGYLTRIGAYKYAFDEINLAADSILFSSWLGAGDEFEYPRYNFCFVIQKYKDSTFYKVLILNRLEDKRYVFKFGTNTTPKNRVLVKSDYDRSIRYKPNNLFYFFNGGAQHRFSWEPPLPSDNHLQGYIIYVQKKGVAIDTTTPINPAQWDSVGFTDSNKLSYDYAPQGEYFNIVALYTEGKSDFLKGWTRLVIFQDIKKHDNSDFLQSSISINYIGGYLSLALNPEQIPCILNIFDLTGKRIAHVSDFNNHIFLNSTQQNIPPGLYLLRAEFPDRSVVTQPFTIMR